MIKYNVNNEIVRHFHSDAPVEIPETYREQPFRAMWVSNVVNIDLPVITGDGLAYKVEITKLLDTCDAYNINAIFFQVRTTNDAFYQSKLNPISRFLTGEEGKEPPFDVLAHVISEANRRDIEVHAWCNPYRISADGKLSQEEYLATCDPLNFAKRHPEAIVKDDKGKLILNPARSDVKQFIIDSMVELAENYDIAGIHFDDYFYPYGSLDETQNDRAEYDQNKHPNETLDDFRRRQVTDVIAGVHKAVKNVDPKLRFGISPFGIWKTKASDPRGANVDPRCGETYYNQYADSYLWVKEGYMDYVVPQIYWHFNHHLAPFADLCDWWDDLVAGTGVELYIGHGAYRLGSEGDWTNPDEITDQVKYANQKPNVKGNVFFTYHTFIDNNQVAEGMRRLKRLLAKD